MRNSRKRQENADSKFKGVYLEKRENLKKPYRARIYLGERQGKYLNLGYFETEKEAAQAYNEAAIKYFGDFACLNEL